MVDGLNRPQGRVKSSCGLIDSMNKREDTTYDFHRRTETARSSPMDERTALAKTDGWNGQGIHPGEPGHFAPVARI
jgi:hypothetical protein